MIQASKLEIGRVYFGLSYEDDDLTRPMVNTYEYLGVNIDGPAKTPDDTQYFFRFVGAEDLLQIREQQIPHVIMDVLGVIEKLKQWAAGKASEIE